MLQVQDLESNVESTINLLELEKAHKKYRFVREDEVVDQLADAILFRASGSAASQRARERKEVVEKIRAEIPGLREAAQMAKTEPGFDPEADSFKARLSRLCRLFGISSRTFNRWDAKLRKSGGSATGLLARRRQEELGSRTPLATLALVQHIWTAHYLKQPDPTRALTYSYELFKKEAAGEPCTAVGSGKRQEPQECKTVSMGTFWSLIRVLNLGVRINGDLPVSPELRARALDFARAEWDNLFSLAKFPLQWVFYDGHRIDVPVVESSAVLGEAAASDTPTDTLRDHLLKPLWLHLIFDVYSRCCIGWHVSHDEPSIEAAQAALYHAIHPKEPGEHDPAIPYGVLINLVLDNAWANHSMSLREMSRKLADYGVNPIALHFKPPYDARRGAYIERFFGTLERNFLHHLRGSILSNPGQRGNYRPYDDLGFTADDLDSLIDTYIRRIYHLRPHGAFRGEVSPIRRWEEGISDLFGEAGPRTLLVPEARYLFRRLDPTPHRVDAGGVRWERLRFNSPGLQTYRKECVKKGVAPRVYLRYDSADIARVSAYTVTGLGPGDYIGEIEARNLPFDVKGERHCPLRSWMRAKALGLKAGITTFTADTVADLLIRADALLTERQRVFREARTERDRQQRAVREGQKPESVPAPPATTTPPAQPPSPDDLPASHAPVDFAALVAAQLELLKAAGTNMVRLQ